MFNRKSGGKLEVKVAEARSLVSATSNVYCVLRLGKEKRNTRTSRNSDTPQWTESFEFPISTACDETLEVLVWDKGRLWRDNFLGMVTISVSSLKDKSDEDQWYKLTRRPNKPKEVVRGDVRLVMSLDLPEEDDEEKEEEKEEKAKEPAGEDDEMALVNAYLSSSQTVSSDKKKPAKPDPKKTKPKPKPKPTVKRSENTISAIVKELQELHQNNPASCVKKIKWDATSRTVTVQLTNVDHGAVNLSIFLGEDASPVTMLEGVSGSVDEKKVERLVDQVNDYSSDQSAALVDILNFLTSRFDRSLNKSQFVSAIRASQLAPKGGAVDSAPRKDKGKEKDDGDDDGEIGSGKPLGISQALGRDWRTASALVPTDDEEDGDEDEYNDSEYDDEDGYIDDDDWDMPAEETLLEKHVKQLHVIFGGQCASVWRDLGVVRLFVDAHFFEEMAAEAMGIDREQPITIILTFGEGYLENDALPKAEVKQPQNPRFALEFQLTHIAQTFITDNWPKRKMGISLPGATEKKERAKMKLRTNDVGNLVKQGFDQLAAANALEITGNNFAKAIKLLKSQGGQVDVAALSSSEEAKHNFLGWMMTYMLSRMRNCSSNCLICDVKLEGSGIKPVICRDEKCVWRYEELGLGVKVTTELSFDEDVVDLFMSMLYAACSSDRKNLICQPFPPDFIKDSQKRHDEVQNCLNCLEGIHELAEFKNDERRLRAYLESKDALLYRLIRWVLSSNRAFIKKLDPDLHLSAMQTPHQYLLLSSPPERKAKFDAYRLQYGSFFAFHGSALENWHAIMRNGLRNLSNTEFMTTGAAYGAGIYLSPHASTSKGYARMGRGWDKSRFGSTNMTCMAICEIIDHPSLAGMPNPHYVVADEELVCTRLFCFYTDKETIPDSVDLASLADALFKLQGFTPAKAYPSKPYSDGY